jgi:hypothetical protein
MSILARCVFAGVEVPDEGAGDGDFDKADDACCGGVGEGEDVDPLMVEFGMVPNDFSF